MSTNWLRGALILGGLPLLFESILFFTWYWTGWSWWARAWAWALLVDVLCLLAGAVCLVRYFRARRQEGGGTRGELLAPALAAGLLLLSLPVGAAYMWAVVQLVSSYAVEVHNESAQTVDSLLVSGPAIERVEIGPIPAGARKCRRLHITGDGALRYSGRQGGREQAGTLDSSAAPSSGGRKRIVVRADGIWEVQRGSDAR